MDQSVSPRETVWLAGTCAAAAGTAWVVSCACRTVQESGAAARVNRSARLERQIVVLLIQRLRERVERLRGLPFGGYLRRYSGAFAAGAPSPSPPTLGRQHDQLARDDLGDVACLLLAVFPGPVLDPPFDVDLIPLLQVLLRDVRQAGALVVPADHAVPLGLLLLFPTLARPLPAGG